MNLELNVVRFENEDVIATSCDGQDLWGIESYEVNPAFDEYSGHKIAMNYNIFGRLGHTHDPYDPDDIDFAILDGCMVDVTGLGLDEELYYHYDGTEFTPCLKEDPWTFHNIDN